MFFTQLKFIECLNFDVLNLQLNFVELLNGLIFWERYRHFERFERFERFKHFERFA